MKKTKCYFCALFTIAIIIFSSFTPLYASLGYKITDLGHLGGRGESRAFDINLSGWVVGSTSIVGGGYHAFIWNKSDGMIDIGTLGGRDSEAYAINNSGQVVGVSQIQLPDGTTNNHAFLWSKDDGMLGLGHLGSNYSIAKGINNNGHVVGFSHTVENERHAFLWTPEAGMVDLGIGYSEAHAINEFGEIVGSRLIGYEMYPYMWSPETGLHDISTDDGSAFSINNNSEVVGYHRTFYPPTSAYDHAFIWDKENGVSDLYNHNEGDSSIARDINNSGSVVGGTNIADAWPFGPFVWTADTGIEILDTLGGTTAKAWAINDFGLIVGESRIASANLDHAVLWEPIQAVSIDIISKTCPNKCSVKGSGSVEVAIHGTVDFDVTDIDIASVRLEGVVPVRSSFKDKSSPVVPSPTECECSTEGKDGFVDLCLKFDKKAILSALEIIVDQEYVFTLSGELNDGTPILGKDCIVFIKNGKKD